MQQINEAFIYLNNSWDLGWMFHLQPGNINQKIENLSKIWEIGNDIEIKISKYFNETKDYNPSKRMQEYRDSSYGELNSILNISKTYKSIYNDVQSYKDYNFSESTIVVIDTSQEFISINNNRSLIVEFIDKKIEWTESFSDEEWNEWAKEPSC
jgi:hypothetical protein